MRGRDQVTRLTIITVLCALFLSSCAKDYVTGKRTFSLVSEAKEIEIGKEADPYIVAEYGLYDDEELSAFVTNLGQSMARKSQRPNLEYTFRVVDSPIINAFALPGGFVYITRGILAHFNSEDELAGVMGHEIGHVVARHGAEQMSRQQLAGVGLGLGAIISEDFRRFADIAGAGVGLLFLTFSRGQESESDMLGVEYSTLLGYDAHKMAGFFQTLKRQGEESGQSLPGFLSTHPDPGDREVRVHQLADEWQKKIDYRPLNLAEADYLKRIDGMVYGDDPRQGFFENQTFYHPTLRFQFPVPNGWKLVNSPSTVQMANSEQKAMIQLTLGKTKHPSDEADLFIKENQVEVRQRSPKTVGGFTAVVVESSANISSGELRVLSYFIEKDGNVYVFHGFTAAQDYTTYSGDFVGTMNGFAEVTEQWVINKQPRRLRIKAAPRNDDLESILSSLDQAPESHQKLAILNGIHLEDTVEKGRLLKVVGD